MYFFFRAVQIEHEGTSFIYCIKIKDFVLIKRDDEDRPYVAKLLKLYEDGKDMFHCVTTDIFTLD